MQAAVLRGGRDVRFEARDAPRLLKPTDAVNQAVGQLRVRVRPLERSWRRPGAIPVGHERCVLVEKIGRGVRSGPHGRTGYRSFCQQRELVIGARTPVRRVPLADGTLVATPGVPSADLIPGPVTPSDVMGTAWFAADAATVKPGKRVAVLGHGGGGSWRHGHGEPDAHQRAGTSGRPERRVSEHVTDEHYGR